MNTISSVGVPQWPKVAVPNQGYGSPTRGHRMFNKKGERRKIYFCCKNCLLHIYVELVKPSGHMQHVTSSCIALF